MIVRRRLEGGRWGEMWGIEGGRGGKRGWGG